MCSISKSFEPIALNKKNRPNNKVGLFLTQIYSMTTV